MPKTLQQNQSQTLTALMNITSRAVLPMSVLSSKSRLMAVYDFYLALNVFLIISERLFGLRETAKRQRLVCSNKCFFSGHAYSMNTVKQFHTYSPSSKGFPVSAIDSYNLRLSFVISSEFLL